MISKRHLALLATFLLDVAVVAVAAPNYVLAGDIFFFLLALKSVLFVVLYAFRSNWKATQAGRAVMGLVACIALICSQATLTIVLGVDYPGRSAVRLILIGAVGMTLMNLLLTLVAAQRNGGDEE